MNRFQVAITAVAFSALISSCGPAPGSHGTEATFEIDRDQLFREEAIQVALDSVVVSCETLECPTADDDIDASAIPGSGEYTQFCSWTCIAATLPGLDGTPETRNHLVQLDWDRFEGVCWDVDDPIVITANINAFPCIPN